MAVPAREPERPAVAPGGKGLQRTHTSVRDDDFVATELRLACDLARNRALAAEARSFV